MIKSIGDKKIKTAIFVLLDLRALINTFDSLTYLVNFRILNILKSLNALRATRLCVPARINDKYMGRVDKRSIIP